MFIPVFSTLFLCGNISLELEVNPTLCDALIFIYKSNTQPLSNPNPKENIIRQSEINITTSQ